MNSNLDIACALWDHIMVKVVAHWVRDVDMLEYWSANQEARVIDQCREILTEQVETFIHVELGITIEEMQEGMKKRLAK